MPPSVDVFNLEHSVDLVIAFRQHVLALVKICPWLKQARVIDRTNILKTKLLRKSQPPDVHNEGDGLVGHVNHKSTAGHIGIQSGPNKGLATMSAELHCKMFHTHSSSWASGPWHLCLRSERRRRYG